MQRHRSAQSPIFSGRPSIAGVAEHNEEPKPFVWKKDPDAIIAAVNPGFQTLESIH
jgi:hypothetical protein